MSKQAQNIIEIYLDDTTGPLSPSLLSRFQRSIARFDSMDEALEHVWDVIQYERDELARNRETLEPYLSSQGVTTDILDALELEPIPGWAIERLADYAGTQVQLARLLEVNDSTVRRWIAPSDASQSRRCAGMSARDVRTRAAGIIKYGARHGTLRVAKKRDDGTLEDAGLSVPGLHIDDARERASIELDSLEGHGAEFIAHDDTVTRLDLLDSLEIGEHEDF